MDKSLSPKQMAQAIGASESSVKRWCDRGLVKFARTGGGHRRISLVSVLEFIRQEKMALVSPETVGLPDSVGRANRSLDSAAKELCECLLAGDEDRTRLIAWDLHLAGHSISEICDEVVAPAFQSVGDDWCAGDVEVYQERRGCEIAHLLIHELRRAIHRPPETGPVAMGAAAPGDPYSLPTAMVELALRQDGWNATSLGAGVPFESLCQAIRNDRPRLFWLSASAIDDEDEFVAGFEQLQRTACTGVALVVGGRALTERIRHRLHYTAYCDKLQNLTRFAATLYQAETSFGSWEDPSKQETTQSSGEIM